MQIDELAKEARNVTLRIVVSDAAVEHLCLFAGGVEQLFELNLDRLVFRHSPTERDRPAEKENAALASRKGSNRPAAQPFLVQANLDILERCRLRSYVVEIERR